MIQHKLKNTKHLKFLLIGVFLVCQGLSAQVQVEKKNTVIPTWEIGPSEKNPAFPGTFANHQKNRKIYPYPYKVNLTQNKVDKEYLGYWLENEFIQVLITPEMGGRLYGAKDKTNNHNFFYWQPTVKPALVGLTGAWVSGGVEWNFPSSHRHTSFSPVSHRVVDNPDGSKTVWVGETEWVFGLRWIVGTTIYPGKSVIEAKVRLMNPTPLNHSFYMWTTTAQNANKNVKLIYPTKYMTDHGETQYSNWPIENGKDLSLWKNTPNARSYFSVDKGGFFGSYDIEKNAGTAIVANENIVIGKKFWTWGTSPSGRIWDTILADGEGPYIEPQAGSYATNQPDFRWIAPEDLKSFSLYFFPVKGIGAYKYANENGALNIELNNNKVLLGVYSTATLKGSTVKFTQQGKEIFSAIIDINPSKPWIKEVNTGENSLDMNTFKISLQDQNGEILLSYQPKIEKKESKPEVKGLPKSPSEIKSTDELFLVGEKLYRFRETEKAKFYFNEIINRDSLNSRANITLAEMSIKKANYKSALLYLQTASMRSQENGKLHYLKGVTLKALSRNSEAYESFYKSTHFQEYFSMAYHQISLIDIKNGNYIKAIEHSEKAIEVNRKNSQLWSINATALRMNKQFDAAKKSATESQILDPLNAMAINELRLVQSKLNIDQTASKELLESVLIDDYQYYINLASKYIEIGLYAAASDILQIAIEKKVKYPALIHYYLGYCNYKLNNIDRSKRQFKLGMEQSEDYVFPFRTISVAVFKTALNINPKDFKANYYLGIVYAGLGESTKAIDYWNDVISINPKHAKSWRNLGLLNSYDKKKSLAYYQNAFKYESQDATILAELYKVAIMAKMPKNELYNLLDKNVEIVEQKDELLSAYLVMLVEHKKYNKALEYYTTRTFNNWEGGNQIHSAYVYACMQMAKNAKSSQDALKFYAMAYQYPENLRVAQNDPDWTGFISYPMAKVYATLGNQTKADSLLKHTASTTTKKPTMVSYYKALALRDLGQTDVSNKLLEDFKLYGNTLVKEKINVYLTALGYYYLAKYHQALDNKEQAEEMLDMALSLNPQIASRAINTAKMKFASVAATY